MTQIFPLYFSNVHELLLSVEVEKETGDEEVPEREFVEHFAESDEEIEDMGEIEGRGYTIFRTLDSHL